MQKMPQSHTFILLRHLHEHEIACIKSLYRQARARRDGCIYWLKYGNSTNPTHRLRITISSKKSVNSMKWLERSLQKNTAARTPRTFEVKGQSQIGHFQVTFEAGSLLCRIAQWKCFDCATS